MKNKRGNIAVIVIIIVIVAITAGVVGWMFAKKTQAPAQQTTASQSEPISQIQADQQKYDIMNAITSAWASGHDCISSNMDVLPGNGGDKICDMPGRVWPIIKACGDNPSDTKWIVVNGSGQEKNITLSCKEVAFCNGQINASCDVNGINACKFSKGCDPRKK